jgi:cardiolipin synthase A/B
MKLIVEPEDGIDPVLHAIARARKTVDVSLFRLDYDDVLKALKAALARGVVVRTLVANRNGTSVKALRKLEMTMLETGATVCRTNHDLVRYHDKIMIVDGETLCVLGFNFTRLDVDKSRSFGIVTRNRELVKEAIKLFEADCTRNPFTPSLNSFLVSPLNARQRLATLIQRARVRLWIYDPNVNDPVMLKLLQDRVQAGVDVRILGKVGKTAGIPLRVQKYPGKRLHVRAIVQDARRVFLGSQSLRKLELDKRREVGLITKDPKTIRGIADCFEKDWAQTDLAKQEGKEARKAAEKERKKRRKKKR